MLFDLRTSLVDIKDRVWEYCPWSHWKKDQRSGEWVDEGGTAVLRAALARKRESEKWHWRAQWHMMVVPSFWVEFSRCRILICVCQVAQGCSAKFLVFLKLRIVIRLGIMLWLFLDSLWTQKGWLSGVSERNLGDKSVSFCMSKEKVFMKISTKNKILHL